MSRGLKTCLSFCCDDDRPEALLFCRDVVRLLAFAVGDGRGGTGLTL